VPIKREGDPRNTDVDGDGDGGSSGTGSGLDEITEDEKMRRFLSSSTVCIPWTYEGHSHSPEAYLQSNPHLTYEQKQELLREAERDSVIFANTIVALAEFISALPEGTNEICICFSCPDRMVRDTMALSIRALAAMPPNCTHHERKSVFPWLAGGAGGPGGEHESLIAESTENEQIETKKLLKSREEENTVLKRERNELTVQLLESREELVMVKSKMQQLQHQATKSAATAPDKRNSLPNKNALDTFAGFGVAAASAPAPAATAGGATSAATTAAGGAGAADGAPSSDIGKGEAFKQLSSKIIELETKISVATKREVC
jgi:hypothetical protein